MPQQRSTTRLQDYWTHLDGTPCVTAPEHWREPGPSDNGVPFCGAHDRRVYPPDPTAEALTPMVTGYRGYTLRWNDGVVEILFRGDLLDTAENPSAARQEIDSWLNPK